jgi:hypothetical protein
MSFSVAKSRSLEPEYPEQWKFLHRSSSVQSTTVGPVSFWCSLESATGGPAGLTQDPDCEAIVGTDDKAKTFVPTWRFV